LRRTYRIETKPGDAYFIPGDLHFPGCKTDALAVAWNWFAAKHSRRRYGVIGQGDTLDCHHLSKHPKDVRKARLAQEVESFRPWAENWAESPLGFTMILGNHEARVRRLIMEYMPDLEGLPGAEFGKLTGLDDIEGLEILGHGDRILLGKKTIVEHGDKMRGGKTGNKSPEAVLRDYPDQVTIYGHTHKASTRYVTVWGPDGPAVRGAINVGTFQREEEAEDFAPDANWQVAFVEWQALERDLFSAKLHLVLPDAKAKGGWVVV
jgi:hypothetical protein